MVIASYQIENVLKVYTRQLKQSKLSSKLSASNDKHSNDKISLSLEGKRQAIINKVASDIVGRITQYGPQDDVDHDIVNKLEKEIGQKVNFNEQNANEFVFNVIDGNDQKMTTKLSVGNSDLLIRRLEELAKEVVNKNMASQNGGSK